MKCFKCNGELKPITREGIGYAQCDKCGTLFTAQELRARLARSKQPQKQRSRPPQTKAVSNASISTRETRLDRSPLEALKREFIAIDFETTGLSPIHDRIIEIGAVRFVNKRAKEAFSTLVHSDVPISPQASRVNGITNEMISTAPSEAEAISMLVGFLEDALQGKTALCAHNASFDMDFLENALGRCCIRSNIRYVDTLSISRATIKGLEDHKQDTVLKYFNFSNLQGHRARSDALCCGKIMCKLIPLLETQNIGDFLKTSELKNIPYEHVNPKDITPTSNNFNISHPLYGKVCVFTGIFEKMTRRYAMQVVVNLGGQVAGSVTKKTDFLFVGDYGFSGTTKFKRAKQLEAEGSGIKIISENAFYEMIKK